MTAAPLAPFVAAIARGPNTGRTLSRAEARAAMEAMLSDEAAPEAVGALLMVLRYRGETAEEIAGLTEGCAVAGWDGIGAGLDWPSYAAGRTRGAPLFLAASVLVARAGVPVLLHGYNSHQAGAASVAGALGPLGIPVARTPEAARTALAQGGIAYAPLEDLNPGLLRLLRLRDTLGLRSCVNTVARMSNPAAAPAAVQGVFHPPYRGLQTDAAAILGRRDIAVVKGGGGEFELNASKAVEIWGLSDGAPWDMLTDPVLPARRLHEPDAPQPRPEAVLAGGGDAFARAVVRQTAELALRTATRLGADAARARIADLFPERTAA